MKKKKNYKKTKYILGSIKSIGNAVKSIAFTIKIAVIGIVIIIIIFSGYYIEFHWNPRTGDNSVSLRKETYPATNENDTKEPVRLSYDKYVSPKYSKNEKSIPQKLSYGWSDSIGGRTAITIADIEEGKLNDQIIFNSISNSTIGHEFNFVGAREKAEIGSNSDNIWNADLIQVECGKQYYIRIYCHNNSPKGYDALAKDVCVSYTLPSQSGKSIVVHGLIKSSNSVPEWYSDTVILTCKRKFHLEYVLGSAKMENNGIGANGGYPLSDKIINDWVPLGYDSVNGEIPGCYQYDALIIIAVNVVAD